MECQDRVVFIILAGKQSLEPLPVNIRANTVELSLCFFDQALILCLVAQLDQRHRIFVSCLELLVLFDLGFKIGGALEDLLRIVHIVPKARLCSTVLELFYLTSHLTESQCRRQIIYLGLHCL